MKTIYRENTDSTVLDRRMKQKLHVLSLLCPQRGSGHYYVPQQETKKVSQKQKGELKKE
jgi:hypothetical protein